MAWATTNQCTFGTNCSGVLVTNTTGSVIQDIGFDCKVNAKSTNSPVAGCVPFWDEYGQERSQLKRLQMSNFATQSSGANFPSIGLGIYTKNAQNGGPFEDLQMQPGTNTDPTTSCVEVGGNGVGTSLAIRGIRGLTCTGPSGQNSVGVDINTQNFALSDVHFENLGVGVEIGRYAAATGVSVEDVTGGLFTTSTQVTTMVDISSAFASSSPATSDISLTAIYQPYTASGQFSVNDHINGNAATEAVVAAYVLGDGTGTGSTSTRSVLTTSSTVNGKLNALTLGTAGSTTGTLLIASSGGGTAALTTTSITSSQTHSCC
jgi:hypothetical protein